MGGEHGDYLHTMEKVHEEIQEEEGVLASLGLNAQLFAFQLLNFVIVAGIVWFLILRPLTKKMEERRVKINESLDKAKEAETALSMSEIKVQRRIDEAKAEANKIIAAGGSDAEKAAEEMKAKAKREIQLLVDQAKRNIQIEREEAIDAVRTEAADLILAAAEKLTGEAMDEKKDRKRVEELLSK